MSTIQGDVFPLPPLFYGANPSARVSKTNSRTYTGRTDGFKLVNFKGTPDMVGKIVDVKITEGKTFSLEGEVL